MKKPITFSLILLFSVLTTFAQTSATWNLTSNGNASTTEGISAGTVSTGPGSRSGGITSMTYDVNGVNSRNWTSQPYNQFSITNSQYNQDYYQYTVTNNSQEDFVITDINYDASYKATGLTSPVSWRAYYSLNGFTTYTQLGGKDAVSHSDLNITVPFGVTFTLRIYGMDFVLSNTAFLNKNVIIAGKSVPPCPPQTADAGVNLSVCKGEKDILLGGSVGGSAEGGAWSSSVGGTFTPNANQVNARWTPPGEFTGTAILTLTTADGCAPQAVSSKTVTVNNHITFNNPQTICSGGSYSINGNTYTSAGTYEDKFQAQNGCDSTVITTITVRPALSNTVSNTQNGTTLVANETNAMYQWIRCDESNAPVYGATTRLFVPQESGSYAVVVSLEACPAATVTSDCISINKDDIEILGKLQVAGLSEFEQKVTMKEGLVLEGLERDSISRVDSTDVSFLFLKGNDGVVKSGGLRTLFDMVYAERTPFYCLDPHYPTWSNKENVLYTGAPCNTLVGIGTNSPQASLHVVGSTITTGNVQIGREASIGALITGYRQGVSTFSLLNLGQYNPQTQTEFTALNLRSDGELTLNRQTNGNLLNLRNTSLNTSVLTINESGELAINRQGNGLFLNFRNTDLNTSIFTVDASGNLYLRNSSRQIFHVNASNQTVFARKIVVDEQTWPDYVFEKEYKLLPLTEVKEFIEENGHLPNIPSREKVLKEGVDLGQMVNILVEKVEELTLYSIQQQEEIERLKQQLLKKQEEEK